MGEVVNLNRVRKRTARVQAEKEAEANRAKFGRSKNERAIDDAKARRHEALLDQHHIDRGDAS
ncbi:DUF4169 family protein [Bradyrhizobium sp. U87765 SZCCT0131]|uniref:DUF4169 family protein n=1 Tax=unclassified Bradyrhizobium TaxID=2631580 RepID=UPI001BAC24C2|nr:DUF4169 family protein [Bradyrhizobium sp. U87765 SZCCT0131]MBR1264244.1 DUF4169 family protein [Bradyrhizobium sp. U87765 SZCCT0134]MBR1307973.1 DUF4169 family protein [Bradyrhizobium sp. U87765 SZCCT0110]MBR1320494.1 DUF4169 family protein [Bradyrhizobium sp. U87765 SZCCT0109]MBR1348393.1 DUF4169 family protein [Bradyrhizobium sp. U87765 SZCCT0048]